jgi:hypothetical protein
MNQLEDYHIELFVGKDGNPYWRLRHSNQQILASSEAYSSVVARNDTAYNIAMTFGIEIWYATA